MWPCIKKIVNDQQEKINYVIVNDYIEKKSKWPCNKYSMSAMKERGVNAALSCKEREPIPPISVKKVEEGSHHQGFRSNLGWT